MVKNMKMRSHTWLWSLLHLPARLASPIDQNPIQAIFDDFPIYWQNETTCAANTKHFTGWAPATEGKELFFSFVESRSDPFKSPTIIWMNGGPGASSMIGLFAEIGPCEFSSPDTTIPNTFSWAEYANLLFIDQPAGVGLSGGSPAALTLDEASPDFSAVVKRFARQNPQYFSGGLYIAGESFGGIYVPRYTSDIVQEQLAHLPGALEVPVRGIILVDAAVDFSYSPLGHYEMFCTNNRKIPVYFNQSTCDAIAAAMPEAERLIRICQDTLDPFVCSASVEYGQTHIQRYLQEQEVDTRKRSPYDLRLPCGKDKYCIPKDNFSTQDYLNRPDIQRQIGLRHQLEYLSINFTFNSAFNDDPASLVPTSKHITLLLDRGELSVLVINGNFDAVVSTPGILREFTDLSWNENIKFRLQPLEPWRYTKSKSGKRVVGGQRKGEGRLQVFAVDDAGHSSPGDQKEGVSSLVGEWLETRP